MERWVVLAAALLGAVHVGVVLGLGGTVDRGADDSAATHPTGPPAIRIEANDSRAGTIYPRGDVDIYEFAVQTAGILQISVRNIPREIAGGRQVAQLSLSLTGPPGFAPWNKFTTDQAREFSSEPLAIPPGTYRIRLKDYFDDAASTDSYTLQTTFTEISDPGEPNDTAVTATPLRNSHPAKGYLFPAGDLDYFKIHLVVPGRVKVIVSDIPPEVRDARGVKALYVGLYDERQRLLREYTSRPRQEVLETAEEVMNAGTYYLCVRDFNGRTFSGSPYTIEARYPGQKGEISPAERDLLEALRAEFTKSGGLTPERQALLDRLEARFLED
jgi:hypothetical protein